MAEQCDRCLFGPDPLVSRERRAELLDNCRQHGRSFECHLSTMRGEKVTCRAFYDQPDRLLPDDAQIAKRLFVSGLMPNAVELVRFTEAAPVSAPSVSATRRAEPSNG